jgi:hypothetical protein
MSTRALATAPTDSHAGAAALRPRLVELAGDGVSRHVVICLFNGMGDAFLALPLIRFVIQSFGRDRVTVWANGYHGRTVYAEVSDILLASSEWNRNTAAERKEEEIAALRRRLPPGRALAWVSLNPYEPRTVVEDYAIAQLRPTSLWQFRGAPMRFDATGSLLHRIDQYFRVIGEYRLPAVDRRPLIAPILRQRAAAIRDHVHRMSKRLVAVHAQTKPYKCWPQSRWEELAQLLGHECAFVILGLSDQALWRSSAFLTAPPEWDKQVAIVVDADAFVGIDSCFAHIADAGNRPGLVLYGDTAAAAQQWRPKGPALEAMFAPGGDLQTLAAADVAVGLKRCLEPCRETAVQTT